MVPMNTNPQAKVVLCYGDSNTWGQNDDKNFAGRYAADVRWTGQLQKLLGDGFYVIEEGLGGRSTDLEHYGPAKPSRNGPPYFISCIASHSPLDWAIIMLGTNDLKIQYGRPVEKIAEALGRYAHAVKAEMPDAKVILVSPIHINDVAPKFAEYYQGVYDAASAQKSRELAGAFKNLADTLGILYFDAGTVAKAGKDGIHLDKASHSALAKALFGIISV
jgi:lysophospholipase L1-like esterase